MAKFFSILIPTRNRPELVEETIVSVLEQGFQDVEIIVSDNSTDSATKELLKAKGLTQKIKLVTPPHEMSMPEHWDWHSTQATGNYVLILTDRCLLKKDSLQFIYDSIQKYSGEKPVDLCTWRWCNYDDLRKKKITIDIPADVKNVKQLSSVAAMNEFLGPLAEYPYALPYGLNSCYRREFGEEVRKKCARLFKPINPDFSSAFQFLACADQVLYLGSTLIISRGLNHSNGRNAFFGETRTYMSALGDEGILKYAPLKSALVENVVFEDYFRTLNEIGLNLKQAKYQPAEYYSRCWKELKAKKAFGIFDKTVLDSYFKEWEAALSKESTETQHTVRQNQKGNWKISIAKLIFALPFSKKIYEFANKIRYFRNPSFASAFEAAGF